MQCDCSRCNSVSCQQRTEAGTFAAYGLLPAATPLILKFASIASGLIRSIGSLIGIAPRGDFAKFKRTLYPFMRTAAAQTGLPVYCMWFGDWVGVNPDGSFGVAIGKEITAHGYYPGRAEEETYQDGLTPFYKTNCDRADGDCVNHPADGYFSLYDPNGVTQGMPEVVGGPDGGTGVSPDAGKASAGTTQASILGGSNLLLIGAAGLAAYLIWGRNKTS